MGSLSLNVTIGITLDDRFSSMIFLRDPYLDPTQSEAWGSSWQSGVKVRVVHIAMPIAVQVENIGKSVVPENLIGQVGVASIDGLGKGVVDAGQGNDQLRLAHL
jgi:hypothetical protein